LNATCDFAPDAGMQSAWRRLDGVLITQGFIASDEEGETVLLGRGGSDTSSAYVAAKLAALRLEIWTDVPGMFSANPRDVPSARLLRALHYDEAQEIASNGAKVLHPRCLLPVRQYRIPLHVYATQAPQLQGTIISASVADSAAQVKAIAIKKGITLVSMESPGMWHQVGFLADAFQVFKQHGLSVDLISTSETTVTVSLDPAANTLDVQAVKALTDSLGALCRVQVIGPCASLSLLGHNIRAILPELGEAFELFQDQKIYLVSQAANDLNFTFVIDESQGDRLVQQLHERLIQSIGSDHVLGPTWEQLFSDGQPVRAASLPWWLEPSKREQLLKIAAREGAAFVYDSASLDRAAASLKAVTAVDRWAYAMKANWHVDILRRFAGAGLMMECVSQNELEHAFASLPGIDPRDILFTPNFAPRSEYEFGFGKGVRVTLDNLHPLKHWPEIFRGKDVFVRVDPGFGRGHHHHVRTAGVHSKFGIPLFEMDEVASLAAAAGARVVGLHAHTGSGIFNVGIGGALSPGPSRRSGRGTGCAGAHGTALDRSRCPGCRRARLETAVPGLSVLDGTRPLSRRAGRRAGRTGDAAQGKGRSTICRHRDRHEFPDPARALWIASRYRQFDPSRGTRGAACEHRWTDLRIRRSTRPGSLVAQNLGRRCTVDRDHRRLRPGDEFGIQPPSSGM
jgi:diaminopimelate decarboxylase/aspartate kinase